jgi:DNA-directed RNA polymerase specialized sigma24 family protein
MVGLVRAYSKRPELLEELNQATRRLARALDADPLGEPVSVRSTGRVGRVWALNDRLSEADMQAIVQKFRAGTPKQELAEQYGISLSSIKRLLRRHDIRLST